MKYLQKAFIDAVEISELNETETSLLSRGTVRNKSNGNHRAELGEMFFQIRFSHLFFDRTNEDFRRLNGGFGATYVFTGHRAFYFNVPAVYAMRAGSHHFVDNLRVREYDEGESLRPQQRK